MTEGIVQILERKDCSDIWRIRAVIQIWPYDKEERDRMDRFLKEEV